MGEYHGVLLIDLSKKVNTANTNQTAQRVPVGLKKVNERLVRIELQDD